MTAVLFIVLLSIIVTIHEFGHFLVAKAFGVYCFEFSIGMGPALFTRKGKETKFSYPCITYRRLCRNGR